MNHNTYLAQSEDGAAWSLVSGFTPYAGSVPDVVRRGNILYFFNPGVLHRYHFDTGAMDPPVNVEPKFANGTRDSFADPSPLLDDEGRIVFFYLATSGMQGQDPARCAPGQSTCTKVFRSATEEAGSDGARFTVDAGNRVEVTINSTQTGSDPDIYQGKEGFVLYVSVGSGVKAFTSTTLRGTYTSIAGLTNDQLTQTAGGVPAGHFDSATNKYWTYVHKGSPSTPAVIRRAVTDRIDQAISDASFVTVLSGETTPGLGSSYVVESPGFVLNVA